MSWRDRATPVTSEPQSSWRDRATPVMEPQEPVDASSSVVLKGIQGLLQGGLDELSGGFEAAGSVFGLQGLGGPTSQIRREESPRTLAQAYEEGARRKQELLDRVQTERPVTSTIAEMGGNIASGVAIPGTAATTLGRMGVGAGLSGISGSLYADGDIGDRLTAGAVTAPIGAIIPAAAAGVSKVASSDLTARAAKEATKKFGRTATTMPEELIERYIDRGRFMNKNDSLIKIADDIPEDLNVLRDLTQKQSGESRAILEAEGVKVPRIEILDKIRSLISKADPNNTSNSTILNKLKQRLDQYTPRAGTSNTSNVSGLETRTNVTPGSTSSFNVSGVRKDMVPTSTRSVVGGNEMPVSRTKRDAYGLIADNDVLGSQKTLAGIQEVQLQSNKSITAPTSREIVTTRPAEVSEIIAPTSREVVTTTPGYKPPDMIEGGKVKDIVQDIGDLISTAEPGFKKTQGGRLADRAYTSLQAPIKDASPAYAAKMKEIDDKMKVLTRTRKRFGAPEKTFNKLRAIGGNQERAHWAKKDLESLESLLGRNYTERVKDAITLDAFTKPGVQGSRSVNAGRAAGRAAGGPVGEAVGAGIGATVDFYGRSILKKGIDLQQRIQFMPPQYRQVFDRAVQKGGNAAAVTHHTLFSKDPEYRKLMQEMDEQAEQ